MDVKDFRRNKQKNLIGYRNFLIRLDQTSVVHQKAKKQKQNKNNKRNTNSLSPIRRRLMMLFI